MPQSLTNVLVHIVFSTKDRYGFLAEPALRDDMHAYLGGASRAEQCPCLVAGGTADHVHLLCLLQDSLVVLAHDVQPYVSVLLVLVWLRQEEKVYSVRLADCGNATQIALEEPDTLVGWIAEIDDTASLRHLLRNAETT